METSEVEKLQFSKVQIGVIVRDLDKAIAYYEALGIGPFLPTNGIVTDRKIYGKPAPDVKNKTVATHIGTIEFELGQPISGESPQRKFLESKGDGISHLGFHVDDIDKETAKLAQRGFKVISGGKYTETDKGGFAFFDTDEIGGIQIELTQQPK